MRYIKLFEELTPSTYTKVAKERQKQLDDIRKSHRGLIIDNPNINRLNTHAMDIDVGKNKNLLTNEKDIINFLDSNKIKNYSIKEGVVNVNGDVNLIGRRLPYLPVKFGKVSGDFVISRNKLKSLYGSPDEVGKSFDFTYNSELESLEYSPISVGGGFHGYNSKLKNLEGMSKSIFGNVFITNCSLESLKGCPNNINGIFNISDNNLKNFEGGPQIVEKLFRVENNNLLESTKGMPISVGELSLGFCKSLYEIETLPSISDIKFSNSAINIHYTPIWNLISFICDLSIKYKSEKRYTCNRHNAGYGNTTEMNNNEIIEMIRMLNDWGVIYKKSIIEPRFDDMLEEMGIGVTIKRYMDHNPKRRTRVGGNLTNIIAGYNLILKP